MLHFNFASTFVISHHIGFNTLSKAKRKLERAKTIFIFTNSNNNKRLACMEMSPIINVSSVWFINNENHKNARRKCKCEWENIRKKNKTKKHKRFETRKIWRREKERRDNNVSLICIYHFKILSCSTGAISIIWCLYAFIFFLEHIR